MIDAQTDTSPSTLAPLNDEVAMRHSKVPPKLVEDCLENPDSIRPVARAMAAINLHNTFVKVSHPNASLKDKLEFQAMVNKIGRIDTKDVEGVQKGAGFSITINIPNMPVQTGSVIEAKATQVTLDDEGDDVDG
jgi:hypothetical protein